MIDDNSKCLEGNKYIYLAVHKRRDYTKIIWDQFHTAKTARQSNWHGIYTVLARSRTTSLKSPYGLA